jgi:LmbE family N-acetylglucosaminyl deacetylase
MNPISKVRSALSSLPIADLNRIAGRNTAMILAPHPDDESLGCGGLIAELCARGCPPVVVIMTDGTASHPSSPSYPPARLRDLREREAIAAVSALGLSRERLHFLRLPDGGMPADGVSYHRIIAAIGRILQNYHCDTIFAPWFYDPHCDHRTTQVMARALAITFNATVLSYPVWGWLLSSAAVIPRPVTGWRLDIGAHMPTKRIAINSHRSQYSDLITDDPKAFRLPVDLLSIFEQPFEVFLRTPS